LGQPKPFSRQDGVVEFAEFKQLWDHLGAGHAEEKATAAEAADPLYPTFQKYDLNNKGYLSQYEVKKMMAALDYRVTTDYMAGLMDLFGDFDKDADGVVQFAEFKKLWEHLGAGHAEAAATAAESSDQLFATFKKYDLNNQGYLSQFEVKQMMVALGYMPARLPTASDKSYPGLITQGVPGVPPDPLAPPSGFRAPLRTH
jgi:Ca2+-binding EF-hand superfamily protein